MGFRRFFSLVVVCAAMFPGMAGASNIYKYVDANGVSHFTNVPGDKRYKPVNLNSSPRQSSRSTAFRSYSGSIASNKFDHHIRRAASAHNVDPMLIKAIIKTESDFNQYAVSPKGAQGLMQLMPETASDLRVNDPFDAGQNIYGGTRYIRNLLDNYQGDVRLSLAAYNAGPSRVKNRIPRFPETINYVSKVMRLYKQYRQREGYGTGTSINVRQLVTVN